TELDSTSQAQLDRGERLTEILKQEQYNPLPVENQVLIIYAGNRGFLDKIDTFLLKEYEEGLYNCFYKEHKDIVQKLAEKKEIDSELDLAINLALKEFTERFIEDHKAVEDTETEQDKEECQL
ncbi:MAG: F0F1 ATP synthase subunit alpha, partial [Candidatus Aminicenantes bacterium]|nr:F0F1 ATP synthase subunit alpha [Candidatus Aminicenantes bacterium]